MHSMIYDMMQHNMFRHTVPLIHYLSNRSVLCNCVCSVLCNCVLIKTAFKMVNIFMLVRVSKGLAPRGSKSIHLIRTVIFMWLQVNKLCSYQM